MKSLIRRKLDLKNLDDKKVLKLLQHTSIEGQLAALGHVRDSICQSSEYSVTNIIISSIIENCLSSESLLVREKSYRVFQLMYLTRKISIRWSDIQEIIITELRDISSAGDKRTLSAALALLSSLNDCELINFICLKTDQFDNMKLIKQCINLTDINLKYISILGFGKIIIRVLCLLDRPSFELDGYILFDSFSDSRRKHDDLCDFINETMVHFTEGLIGQLKLPTVDLDGNPIPNASSIVMDSLILFDTYSEILLDVFCLYNSYVVTDDNIIQYTKQLLGQYINLPYQRQQNQVASHSLIIEIAKIVQSIVKKLFCTQFILFIRQRKYSLSQSFSSFVSQVILVILQELPLLKSTLLTSISLISSSPQGNFFAFDSEKNNDDETAQSIVNSNKNFFFHEFVYEWVNHVLMQQLQGCSDSSFGSIRNNHDLSEQKNLHLEMYQISKLYEIASITQHHLLTDIRVQTNSAIFSHVIRLLETAKIAKSTIPLTSITMAKSIKTALETESSNRYGLLVLGVKLISDIPTEHYIQCLSTLFKYIIPLHDDVFITRISTEIVVQMIKRMTESPFQISSESNTYSNYFLKLFETTTISQAIAEAPLSAAAGTSGSQVSSFGGSNNKSFRKGPSSLEQKRAGSFGSLHAGSAGTGSKRQAESANELFKHRFLAASTRVMAHLLPIAIARVHQAAENVLQLDLKIANFMKSKKPEVDKRDVAVISNSKCGNNLTAFIPSLFTYQKIYAVSDYFDSVDAEESLQVEAARVYEHLAACKRMLFELLTSIIAVLKQGIKCLSWPYHGVCSDAAALSYTHLLLSTSILLSPLVKYNGLISNDDSIYPCWAFTKSQPVQVNNSSVTYRSEDFELYSFALEFADILQQITELYFQGIQSKELLKVPDSARFILFHTVNYHASQVFQPLQLDNSNLLNLAQIILYHLQNDLFLNKILSRFKELSSHERQKHLQKFHDEQPHSSYAAFAPPPPSQYALDLQDLTLAAQPYFASHFSQITNIQIFMLDLIQNIGIVSRNTEVLKLCMYILDTFKSAVSTNSSTSISVVDSNNASTSRSLSNSQSLNPLLLSSIENNATLYQECINDFPSQTSLRLKIAQVEGSLMTALEWLKSPTLPMAPDSLNTDSNMRSSSSPKSSKMSITEKSLYFDSQFNNLLFEHRNHGTDFESVFHNVFIYSNTPPLNTTEKINEITLLSLNLVHDDHNANFQLYCFQYPNMDHANKDIQSATALLTSMLMLSQNYGYDVTKYLNTLMKLVVVSVPVTPTAVSGLTTESTKKESFVGMKQSQAAVSSSAKNGQNYNELQFDEKYFDSTVDIFSMIDNLLYRNIMLNRAKLNNQTTAVGLVKLASTPQFSSPLPQSTQSSAQCTMTSTSLPVVNIPLNLDHIKKNLVPMMSTYAEKPWKILSGSCDIFTILGHLEIDLVNQKAIFFIRIVNSADFKIPATFSLSLLLLAPVRECLDHNKFRDQTIVGANVRTSYTPQQSGKSYFRFNSEDNYIDHDDVISNSYTSNITSDTAFEFESNSNDIPGVDNFLPHSMIERQVNLSLTSIQSCDLTVQVHYHDIIDDQSTRVFKSQKEVNNPSTDDSKKLNNPGFLDGFETTIDDGFNSNNNKKIQPSTSTNCTVQMSPYHVSLLYFLLPYGNGLLSIPVYDRSNYSRYFGIEESVFTSQWDRLNDFFNSSVNVEVNDNAVKTIKNFMIKAIDSTTESDINHIFPKPKRIFAHTLEALLNDAIHCRLLECNRCNHDDPYLRLCRDARVHLLNHSDKKSSTKLLWGQISTRSDKVDSADNLELAWSFQTVSNQEVAIKIKLFDPTSLRHQLNTLHSSVQSAFSVLPSSSPSLMNSNSSKSMEGRVDIRCSHANVLTEFLKDIHVIVEHLTAGLIGVRRN